MAVILRVVKQGGSLYICVKQELCKKLNLKHGDFVAAELVELEKDAIGKTYTCRYGEEAEPNSLLIKKNDIKL